MNPYEMLQNLVRDPVNTLKNGTQKAVEIASGLFAVAFVVESVKYSVNESGYVEDMTNAALGRETVETTSRIVVDNAVRSATMLVLYKTGLGNVVYNVGGKIIPGMLRLAGEGVAHAAVQHAEDVKEAINNKIEDDKIPVAEVINRNNRRATIE